MEALMDEVNIIAQMPYGVVVLFVTTFLWLTAAYHVGRWVFDVIVAVNNIVRFKLYQRAVVRELKHPVPVWHSSLERKVLVLDAIARRDMRVGK